MVTAKTTVCLASLRKGEEIPEFQQLQITDELAAQFLNVVQEAFNELRKHFEKGDLVLRPYDVGSKPDPHEIEHVALTEHEAIAEQIKSLVSLADIGLFCEEEDFISGLRFYVIVVQPRNGPPIYCFRTYSKKSELHRSKKFAALFTKGHYDTVEQPMFLFDVRISSGFLRRYSRVPKRR